MSRGPVRVALVDDHSYLRAGLIATLNGFEDIDVVASVPTVEALDEHTGVRPDVVVLDLYLGQELSGVPAVRHLCRQGHRVLLVTGERDPGVLLAAIRAGALGFLSKSGDASTLRSAIRATAAGECLVSPAMAARMEIEAKRANGPQFPPALHEVLQLLAYGLDNQAIARRRSVSLSTVKKQVRQIRDIYTRHGHSVPDRFELRAAAEQTVRAAPTPVSERRPPT